MILSIFMVRGIVRTLVKAMDEPTVSYGEHYCEKCSEIYR